MFAHSPPGITSPTSVGAASLSKLCPKNSRLSLSATMEARGCPQIGHRVRTMGVEDWNWRLATDLQDYAWDCAACSLAWCLRSVGFTLTEQDVINGLGPSRISPTLGLLDASGAGLVSYCAELGVDAQNSADASWNDLVAAAGYQPMLVGGRAWNHWVAVRMGADALWLDTALPLLLMNPSPGYMGVYQTLSQGDFDNLGPFSAVWFNSWP